MELHLLEFKHFGHAHDDCAWCEQRVLLPKHFGANGLRSDRALVDYPLLLDEVVPYSGLLCQLDFGNHQRHRLFYDHVHYVHRYVCKRPVRAKRYLVL